jgi:hypothetical protein
MKKILAESEEVLSLLPEEGKTFISNISLSLNDNLKLDRVFSIDLNDLYVFMKKNLGDDGYYRVVRMGRKIHPFTRRKSDEIKAQSIPFVNLIVSLSGDIVKDVVWNFSREENSVNFYPRPRDRMPLDTKVVMMVYTPPIENNSGQKNER